jgi:histidinol-phosphate aminotransferase
METSVKALSRRKFTQLLGLGAAATALRPAFAAAAAAPAARRATAPLAAVPKIVRLSSNENPYGPSPAAFDAMRAAFGNAWRYPDEGVDELAAALAAHHKVAADHVLLGDGSSEILKICAAAFTGPGRPAVTAEPTFEALARYAKSGGADVVQVPLTAEHQHDLPKMLAAAGSSGLVYVCNPNNPTATITPKDRVRDFISALPAGVVALVDEAYFHFAEDAQYESVIPLVEEHPNLVVARTFSKIYGMAGLRCGYAAARPETLEQMRAHQPWDSLNVMALAAARAGLGDTAYVAESRRRILQARAWTTAELERMGYHVLPSATNFLMADLRRPVKPVIDALREHRVEVGRLFPAMPTHLRVTIGTQDQMKSFVGAFQRVMA